MLTPEYPRPEVNQLNQDLPLFSRLEMSKVPQEELQRFYDEMNRVMNREIVTYGALATDAFFTQVKNMQGFETRSQVAKEEDKMLELKIPDVWYFAQGPNQFGEVAFYIDLQKNKFSATNRGVFGSYGEHGIIECYKRTSLKEFAKKNNYYLFTNPHDLVEIGRHVLNHFDEADLGFGKDVEFFNYAKEVISDRYKGYEEGIALLKSMTPDDRKNDIYAKLKSYWQEVLAPKGIESPQGDIIIIDKDRAQRPEDQTLDYTRQPDFVIIGANLDEDTTLSLEESLRRNLELAQNQYPGAKILLPRYSDGALLQLSQPTFGELTNDSLICMLAMLKENGHEEEYNTLLTQYSEMCEKYSSAA